MFLPMRGTIGSAEKLTGYQMNEENTEEVI